MYVLFVVVRHLTFSPIQFFVQSLFVFGFEGCKNSVAPVSFLRCRHLLISNGTSCAAPSLRNPCDVVKNYISLASPARFDFLVVCVISSRHFRYKPGFYVTYCAIVRDKDVSKK